MDQDHAIGDIAGPDDIAPQGTVITAQHIADHQAATNAAHARLGLPLPYPTD